MPPSDELDVPEHLLRFPTRAAIDALAKRFGLANEPGMQDWEYQVADPDRIDEFVAAYESGELSEDERFTLMETIIQSFEDLPGPLEADPRWFRLIGILEDNVRFHGCTIWYWSALDQDDLDECWRVTPFMRSLLEKHRTLLETA